MNASIIILLALLLCAGRGFVVAEELPNEIVLRSDTTAALYRDGKFSRAVQLRAGQALRVVRFEKGNFVTEYEGGEVKIDRFSTELARTNMAALLRMTQVTNAPAARVAGAAPLTAEAAWNKAKLALFGGRLNESQYIGEDRQAVRALIEAAEAVTKAYEGGDTNRALELWNLREQLWGTITKGGVNGYKYNEFVKGEVIVPVVFDLYSGGEDFYFKVGHGSFSTVATVPLHDWSNFLQSVKKVDGWVTTCRAEKLETRKEICAVGSSTFTFVAFDQGKMWRVVMEIRGDARQDALVEEQTVTLAPLNLWRLVQRMSGALEIARKRLREEETAKRLR